MRHFIVLAFAFFAMAPALGIAQDDLQDVVYLKNGGIVRGMIVEHVIGKKVKILTPDRNVFVFSYEEIDKLAKEPQKHLEIQLEFNPSGYLGLVNGGILIREEINGLAGTKVFGAIGMAHGAYLSKRFSLALGVEWNGFPQADMIPVYIESRFFFSSHQIGPFLRGDLGYSFGSMSIRDSFRSGKRDVGGFLGSAGGGIRIFLSDRTWIYLETTLRVQWTVGFQYIDLYQHDPYNFHPGDYSYSTKDVTFGFIIVRTGIAF